MRTLSARLGRRWAVLVLPLLVCLGCGPSAGNLNPVKGKITFKDGKPLTKGAVVLRPNTAKGNTSKFEPMGTIGPDGSYEVYTQQQPGAAAGTYFIHINAQGDPPADNPYAIPPPLVHPKYQTDQADFTVEVGPSAAPGKYDFQVTGPD